jgi:hypothetical protein
MKTIKLYEMLEEKKGSTDSLFIGMISRYKISEISADLEKIRRK